MAPIPHCNSFALSRTCSEGELCQLPHILANVLYALDSVQRRTQTHRSACGTQVASQEFIKAGDENTQNDRATSNDELEEILRLFATLTTSPTPVTVADKQKGVGKSSPIRDTKKFIQETSRPKSKSEKQPKQPPPKSTTKVPGNQGPPSKNSNNMDREQKSWTRAKDTKKGPPPVGDGPGHKNSNYTDRERKSRTKAKDTKKVLPPVSRGADTNLGPPYKNSINMDREKLGYLWARSYDC